MLTLKPGKYTIRAQVRSGFAETTPKTFAFTVTVTAGLNVTGEKFGMKPGGGGVRLALTTKPAGSGVDPIDFRACFVNFDGKAIADHIAQLKSYEFEAKTLTLALSRSTGRGDKKGNREGFNRATSAYFCSERRDGYHFVSFEDLYILGDVHAIHKTDCFWRS